MRLCSSYSFSLFSCYIPSFHQQPRVLGLQQERFFYSFFFTSFCLLPFFPISDYLPLDNTRKSDSSGAWNHGNRTHFFRSSWNTIIAFLFQLFLSSFLHFMFPHFFSSLASLALNIGKAILFSLLSFFLCLFSFHPFLILCFSLFPICRRLAFG